MKIKRYVLASVLLFVAMLGIYLLYPLTPPVKRKAANIQGVEVVVYQPVWGVSAGTVVFADASQYSLVNLAQRLASMGMVAAVIDTTAFLQLFNAGNQTCLDVKRLSDFITTVEVKIPALKETPLYIAGLGEGALIPFINTLSGAEQTRQNISIGFTVKVPDGLNLCLPLTSLVSLQERNSVAKARVKTQWRVVWNEKPDEETAIFIKEKTPNADTDIAAYNSPLDSLLVNELKAMTLQGNDMPPMPVIEMPAEKNHGSITLFYSGDGGWRDLDKSVAEEMAKLDHPVLGVDVLRYFWERKTPEQVTSDLIATIRYYRTKWGVKSFVLAGFSFGADILPVIYNKLPQSEKDNIDLLVFLALGNHADFEVHVAGWLGQSTHEMPLAPELVKIPKNKMLCVYGKEEKAKTGTACTSLENSGATIIELPGGHHFDKDYPKLARLMLDNYRQHGIH